MTEARIKTLVEEAAKYPIELRVAAKLYVEGVTETAFASMKFPLIPGPTINKIQNYLRDLEGGMYTYEGQLSVIQANM